jgi:hypothetical protein
VLESEIEVSEQSAKLALTILRQDWRYKSGLNDGFQAGENTSANLARNMEAQRDMALIELYKVDAVACAKLCDERFDRSGKLLGDVRKWVSDGQ